MEPEITEANYPLSFRKDEAKTLGQHLSHNQNVELIGMKRVGISNFLRFFLYHKKVHTTYIGGQNHLFIPVDLNDLVERELFPFWTLTLKRITDSVNSSSLPVKVKAEIEALFLSGIQSQDLFLLIDAVRQALLKLVGGGFHPTVFFIRFDRIKDAVNPTFFNNLQGLRDATHHKLSYVFTSYRTLDILSSQVFPKAETAGFTHVLYIKPAKETDLEHIYESLRKRYALSLDKEVKRALFTAVAGNVQYLQLALIMLSEKKDQTVTPKMLISLLEKDERILLQSEELWESLTVDEKEVLKKVLHKKSLPSEAGKKTPYLLNSGFIQEEKGVLRIFSPLLADYVKQAGEESKGESEVHFTKKEHNLFSLLEGKKGDICTREEIIEAVWSEAMEFGVSDWAIDRLVARVRSKLRSQKSPYEIATIRTRGYKLQESPNSR